MIMTCHFDDIYYKHPRKELDYTYLFITLLRIAVHVNTSLLPSVAEDTGKRKMITVGIWAIF